MRRQSLERIALFSLRAEGFIGAHCNLLVAPFAAANEVRLRGPVAAPPSTLPPSTVAPAAPVDPATGASTPGLFQRYRWLALATVLLAGLLVFSPAVRSQFLLDDYLHASMIDGSFPVHRGPLNLYDFVDTGERDVLVERGMLPWWSHPELRIRFLRPLSSLLRWSEQTAFGRGALVPHLHSLLWWAAAVLASRRLFRRLMPPRAAMLATAVLALSPCHALPIAWLANREALVSLTFGALALTSYLRFREDGGLRHAAAATLLFAAALAGGEYALCLGGYVLAFELLARRESLGRRALGLLTYAVPAAGYLAARAMLGYGTHGSSFYNDPLHEPLAFLQTAPRRLCALVTQEWMTIDGDDATSPWAYAALAGIVLVLAVVPIRHVLRALDAKVRHRAWVLLLGAQLALVPVLAVDPSPRVLGLAMLGMAPIFALILDHAWFPAAPPERRGAAELTGLVALGIGFAQFVHGPVTAWMIGEHYRRTSVDFVDSVAEVRERMTDPPNQELVVLRGGPSSFFLPFALAGSMPGKWRVLATTGHALGLRRDARAMELVVPKGQSMLSWFSWDLFRNTATTFETGQVIETPGLRATILEVGSEGPRRVRFELDRNLDDSSLVWINESAKGSFPEVRPPRPGFGQPYDP